LTVYQFKLFQSQKKLWKSSGKNTKNTSNFDAPKNTRSSVKLTVYQFKLFQSQKKLWKSSGKNTNG